MMDATLMKRLLLLAALILAVAAILLPSLQALGLAVIVVVVAMLL